MNVSYEERAHADYLELVCIATYEPEMPLRIAEDGLLRAVRGGYHALLLDIRSVIVTGREPTLSERYDQAVGFTELQLRIAPNVRVALIGHLPLVHPERFGEVVATNRGALIGVFTEETLALEWLLGNKPRK
jgi:hypothetical protein